MRTCDADAMIKGRYGNQLQITHEAEVKVSYFRLQVLTRCFTGLSNEYALVYIDKLYINI